MTRRKPLVEQPRLVVSVVQQITRPQHSPGVNWGGPVTVFCKRGDRELWQTPYHKIVRRPEVIYQPARLVLVEQADLYWRERKGATADLCDKPRPNPALFMRHAEQINDFFGCQVADLLRRLKCVVIEEV